MHPSRAQDVVHRRSSLALDPEETKRIVVVADTHSKPHPRSAELIRAIRPHHILHAGDIGSIDVLDKLAAIAPVTAVRGNIDPRRAETPDVVTLDVRDGDRTLLTLLLLHIAMDGPRLRADARRLADSECADVVVCGHSHVPFLGQDGRRVLFNAGSIGPKRFQLPIVFGVLEVGRGGATMRHVSCETGETFRP